MMGFYHLLNKASPASYVVLQINFFIFGQTQSERIQNLLQRELAILWIHFRSSHGCLRGSADDERSKVVMATRY